MTNTKQKILEKGAWLVRKKGFNHTGIQEILNEAGVPKGSFYFYFKSKEEFGLELIDVYLSFFKTQMENEFRKRDYTGIEKIKVFLNFFNNLFISEDYEGGCPIGNLAQEMGDLNDNFRKKLSSALKGMEGFISSCLNEAIERGEISRKINVHEYSSLIINSWEGAVTRMKVEKSIEPIKLMEKMLIDSLK